MKGLEDILRERQQAIVEGEKTLREQKHKTRKVSEKVGGVAQLVRGTAFLRNKSLKSKDKVFLKQ